MVLCAHGHARCKLTPAWTGIEPSADMPHRASHQCCYMLGHFAASRCVLQDDLNHIGQGLLRMAEQAMSTGIHHLLAAAVAVMQLWAESRLPDRASELNMPGLTDHTRLVVSAVCLAVKMRICFTLSNSRVKNTRCHCVDWVWDILHACGSCSQCMPCARNVVPNTSLTIHLCRRCRPVIEPCIEKHWPSAVQQQACVAGQYIFGAAAWDPCTIQPARLLSHQHNSLSP